MHGLSRHIQDLLTGLRFWNDQGFCLQSVDQPTEAPASLCWIQSMVINAGFLPLHGEDDSYIEMFDFVLGTVVIQTGFLLTSRPMASSTVQGTGPLQPEVTKSLTPNLSAGPNQPARGECCQGLMALEL